ncbi:TonB-dependent receptor [Phaeocystidibacter luteus]|uniref:TonB-dependent receptor plug domain-containing protein n=1 Tax=Phaeocystidibacter luteus TaxID=911197 RepID=A0A6N6RE37_9FLAO|nr:TonB-dependent receptor [Phaeocystidibacter luteus]KAB2807655.1 TonB-dependent receptor plug domain-containing protein [Phaeocystidibacter luteus]
MRKTLLLLFLCASAYGWGQTHTVNGYVSDASSGEKIIYAYVYDRVSGIGTRTNDYGFYSLNLTGDTASLLVSFISFTPQEISMKLVGTDIPLNIELIPDNLIEEVLIEESKTEVPIQEESQMSTIRLDVRQVRNLPVLLGETDLLKTIQLLPGVQSGSEGSSGFYVRGGGPDQNLVLIDGVPVYNVSHLFGFFSIFNGDAVKSVELIKGGFPAEYGGRLSSVLDIRMKEGNMREFHGEGSIGLISSRFTFEGPIWKDRTSFIFSARRTYIDALVAPLIAAVEDGTSVGYYFYDLNGKVNHRFNDNHHLYFSIYNGLDKFSASDEYEYFDSGTKYTDRFSSGLDWGNTISSLRWNWRVNSSLFLNTTATYTRYKFNVDVEEETKVEGPGVDYREFFAANYLSDIEDYGVRFDFDWFPHPNHEVKFGGAYVNHTFRPGINTFESSADSSAGLDTTYGSTIQYANEFQIYARDNFDITDRLKVNLGVHASLFNIGSENYTSVQPRVSARYLLNDKSSIKASYANMTQFLHLLTNQTTGLPTDLWVPATENIRPQQSWQVAMGYAQSLPWDLQFSAEVYYKEMSNLIEYQEGAGFFLGSTDWQSKVTVGRGTSYGLELLLEKKVGKTTGWIGYTLSKSTRQFDEVNFGNPYPYTYDRRHDLSIALTHKLSDTWTFGAVFVYGTGNAVTLPTAQFVDVNTGQLIEYVDQRNNYRAPSYHRLDLSFTHTKKVRWGESIWQFGIYNVYSRQNPFYLYFQNTVDGRELRQVSLFPILPSVSWSFKF